MRYQIATRAQILGLLAVGFEHRQIFDYTGVSPDTQKTWWTKALKRGFDPSARPVLILDCHVEDGKRTGRPRRKDDDKGNEKDNGKDNGKDNAKDTEMDNEDEGLESVQSDRNDPENTA